MNLVNEIQDAGLTVDQYESCLKTIIDKKNNVQDIDWQEIKEDYNLNISVDTLRKANSTIFGGAFVSEYLTNKINTKDFTNNYISEQNRAYEFRINKDGTYCSNKLIMMSETESKDPEYILKAHGFDIDTWKLVSVRNTIRQVTINGDIKTLYSSFITVKPNDSKDISLKKYKEFFDRLDRNYSIPLISNNTNHIVGDKLLLLDIADLHFNLQASDFTTNNIYNCDIAEKLFFNVIEDVLTRTKQYVFDEIVLCIGGDMLNSDNIFGTTTKGTNQDDDIHYYDAYERLCNITIKAIDLLKNYGKVNVIYIMGNHDETSGFKLAKYIDAWFRSEDLVTVNYQPIYRKYKVFGKTLMCFAHDSKVQDLPAIVANEAREFWSQVENVEIFLQHLHKEQILMEEHNIRIQRLPTISAKSKWTSDNGYGAKRQFKSFVFDKEFGLTDVLYTPLRKVE